MIKTESHLDLSELDAVSGGASLDFRGFRYDFDGSWFNDGLGRVTQDIYQHYFPNAASNQVTMALQERQIRDAMSDLREQPYSQMPEYQMPNMQMATREQFDGYAASTDPMFDSGFGPMTQPQDSTFGNREASFDNSNAGAFDSAYV